MRAFWVAIGLIFVVGGAAAQGIQQTKGNFQDKFRQLDEVLPTPNVYRNAAGEPGYLYWQQQADYQIIRRNGDHQTLIFSDGDKIKTAVLAVAP